MEIKTTANQEFKKQEVEEVPTRELVDVLVFPDSHLYRKTKRVTKEDKESVEILKEVMTHTLDHYDGFGLAANQIGPNLSVLRFRYEGHEGFLINPEIVETKGTQVSEEGCLSFPQVMIEVERYWEIKVKHDVWNEKTNNYISQVTKFNKEISAIIQHEIDHLNGIVFIKYLSDLKRKMVTSKMKKMKRKVRKFKKMMEQFE